MVIAGLLTKILPIAAVGLGIAFLYNVLNKPGQASESAAALGQTFASFGSGLGSLGGGISGLLTGIGQGSAKLLDPLFTLKTLFYGSNSVGTILQEQSSTASNTTRSNPVVNTASDQPGVTPETAATATSTADENGGFTQTTTSTAPATETAVTITSRREGKETRYS